MKKPATQKKPAAVDAEPVTDAEEETVNVDGTLQKAAEDITPYDRRKLETALLKGSVSQAVVDGWKAIANLGYGQNKEQQKRLHIAAWKEKGFKHPLFAEMIRI
eukprot:5337948-Karenia_brevis.AAC.1